jgi:uncharacterized protein YbbC (DUF1343 family)
LAVLGAYHAFIVLEFDDGLHHVRIERSWHGYESSKYTDSGTSTTIASFYTKQRYYLGSIWKHLDNFTYNYDVISANCYHFAIYVMKFLYAPNN